MKIFEKLFCCHDWEIVNTVKYADCVVILLKCKKCGKLVKKTLETNLQDTGDSAWIPGRRNSSMVE